MTPEIEALLQAELDRLDGMGPSVVGFDQGLRWARRRLGDDTHGVSFTLILEPLDAFSLFVASIQAAGRVLGTAGATETPDGLTATGPLALRGFVDTGVRTHNPALVQVSIEPLPDGTCRVEIDGFAKEGLWKQHSAKKAVEQVFATAMAFIEAAERQEAAQAHI